MSQNKNEKPGEQPAEPAKENLTVSPFTAAVAQTCLQGFVRSYWEVLKGQVICTLKEN